MKRAISLLFIFICFNFFGQEQLAYQVPKKALKDLVDVDLAPRVLRNSSATKMVLLYRPTYKSIADLSKKELRIAGLRVDPERYIGSRTTYIHRVAVVAPATSKTQIDVSGLPEHPKLSNFRWSPDEQKIAMTHTASTGVELWVLDVNTKVAKKVFSEPINATLGSSVVWLKDSNNLLVKLVPKDHQPIVNKNEVVPVGPKITENNGEKAQNRTYQDLIKNPIDAQNFKQLSRSTLHLVSLDGSHREFLPTKMYRSVQLSPNGKYVLLNFVKTPFSYLVPYYRFPLETRVYDLTGQLIKTIDDAPLQEVLPKGFMAVKTGKRAIGWRSDRGATLYYYKAQDGGDPEFAVAYRDALYQWEAPFTAPPKKLTQVHNRIAGIVWGNATTAILYDRWWNTRNLKSYVFNPSKPEQAATIISDRNYQDVYSDPGDFVTKRGEWGKQVLALKGNKAYLLGDGFTEKGQFPFLDQIDLKAINTKRLYESSYTNKFEQLLDFNPAKNELFARIESKTDYPNYYIRSLSKKNKLDQLTFFQNPFESLGEVEKELITYKRKDGLDLSGVLYTPAGYDKSNPSKLPMILWAYPREYKDKSSAAQKTNNPNRFIAPSWGSPIYWVTQGYVVLDRAAFPIIGEGNEEPNDTFRSQLVANAEAAIDAVAGLGYADRERVAVGGHSYGAFMVANLLSHSNLFAAGIARSGAYNRTLTPFGFQSESRSYWEAPEVYYTMSPFMHAEKMKTPLLLIHGEADNNSGTYPMQSERYYNALKGLGATTRLVMFPKESHGYRAKETILHLIWEQDQWLEKYVKNKNTNFVTKKDKPKG